MIPLYFGRDVSSITDPNLMDALFYCPDGAEPVLVLKQTGCVWNKSKQIPVCFDHAVGRMTRARRWFRSLCYLCLQKQFAALKIEADPKDVWTIAYANAERKKHAVADRVVCSNNAVSDPAQGAGAL